ncbi:hypothetical protein ACP4OV_031907 [Aristida adscensionis]
MRATWRRCQYTPRRRLRAAHCKTRPPARSPSSMGSAPSSSSRGGAAATTTTAAGPRPATMVLGLRGLRRRSVALAAASVAAAAVGVAAEVAGVWRRCGTREKAAVAAVAALAAARIGAMVGMARAQEVTALAVASDADGGGGGGEAGPTPDFARRETRVRGSL